MNSNTQENTYKQIEDEEFSSIDFNKEEKGKFQLSQTSLIKIIRAASARKNNEILNYFEKASWSSFLEKALWTNLKTGITDDIEEMKEREEIFGSNAKEKKEIPTFWELIKEALDDFILKVN